MDVDEKTSFGRGARSAGVAGMLLLCAVQLGCAHGAAPGPTPQTIERNALVGQPCAALRASRPASEGGFGRVFVEVASVSPAERVPEPVGPWLVEHPIAVDGVASLLLEGNQPRTVPWSHCPGAACSRVVHRDLTITPSLPRAGSDGLQLDLRLAERGGSAERTARVETHDQTSVVVDLPDQTGANPLRLLVTPYLLRDDGDLKQLFACKQSIAARASR